jgi:hypothetical protein
VVGGFFRFCQDQGWIHGANPYRGVKRIGEGDDALGTGVFSDEQWKQFLDVVSSYMPPSVDRADKAVIQLPQRTFWELVRWTGMALIDAVQFSPSLVDANKTYLPWVKELEEAHLEICDEALLYSPALAKKAETDKLIQQETAVEPTLTATLI